MTRITRDGAFARPVDGWLDRLTNTLERAGGWIIMATRRDPKHDDCLLVKALKPDGRGILTGRHAVWSWSTVDGELRWGEFYEQEQADKAADRFCERAGLEVAP